MVTICDTGFFQGSIYVTNRGRRFIESNQILSSLLSFTEIVLLF